MTAQTRCIFIVSDHTGLTAKSLTDALMSQFPNVEAQPRRLSFIDDEAKATAALGQINAVADEQPRRPIVFSTLTNPSVRAIVKQANALVLDMIEMFIGPLESELSQASTHRIGGSHGIKDIARYDRRIEAVHFALRTDDGLHVADYASADVILVGVSRVGKTPTSLYLALQYGLKAANYPLLDSDLEAGMPMPESLHAVRDKLYGLTISPARLHQIREIRRPGSEYASLARCQREITDFEMRLDLYQIPYADSTEMSIEEIATVIALAVG